MTIFTLGEGPTVAETIGVVMKIEDRRKVDLGTADVELGYVRGPFGVPEFGRELAVQHFLGCLADLSSEGVVPFATAHRAGQPELAHEFEHGLLRHLPPLSEQDAKNAPVPVCAVGCLEYATNGLFDVGLGVPATEPAPVVVERRPGKVRDLQQEGQRVVRLEVVDSSNFRPSFPRPQGP